MKRTIVTGILVVAAGASCLMAQKGKNKNDKSDNSQPAAAQQPAASNQPKGPAPKSKAEMDALQALFGAQGNPDATITAAENVITKYADTEFKDTVLFMEAQAYRQKGDTVKAQVYAERALAANPKNFQASLMLAETTAQGTRETDLDKDEKLAKADKYANDSIASVNAATKPNPQLSDQQWEDIKKDLVAQAHDALGMSALARKNFNGAADEFKMAVDGAAHPEPAYQVRLASAYSQAGKYDEAITLAEKIMNDPQAVQQVKSVAQAVRAGAIQAKNKAGQGSTTSAPPQIEVKKP